jgi:hypothetical protein
MRNNELIVPKGFIIYQQNIQQILITIENNIKDINLLRNVLHNNIQSLIHS